MSKYDGDWATREVAKSSARYLAKRAISAGERKPRTNYPHAAKNSAKRDPNGRRGPKYGKSASRDVDKTRASDAPPLPGTPINFVPSPLPDQATNYLPGPLEFNGLLSAAATQLPHNTRPHSESAAESTMIFPRSPDPHIVNRWNGHNPSMSMHQVQGSNGLAHHRSPYPYSHPHLDQPFAGPSQEATAGLHFHPGQGIQNPAFMENMYQLKGDRTPSPLWNANEASGSGSRCN